MKELYRQCVEQRCGHDDGIGARSKDVVQPARRSYNAELRVRLCGLGIHRVPTILKASKNSKVLS